MSIGRLNIKQERIKAGFVIIGFVLTSIFVYLVGPSLFIMFTSVQTAFVSFACLIEYIVLWYSTDEDVKKFRISLSYWFFLFLWLLQFSSQILQILVGIESIERLFQPSLWIAWWSIIIACLLGIMIVRQIYILKPPQGVEGVQDISA